MIKVYAIKDIFLILVIVIAISCGIGEYLDYSNCKCWKKLIDPLAEECTENIDETKLVNKTLEKNENKDQCSSYVVYKVLFWLFFILFITNTKIGIYFAYYKYMNHNKKNVPRYDYTYWTTIY